MTSYLSIVMYGVGGIVVTGMALLVAFQEKLVYVPVLPGLTKSYPITPARLRLIYDDVWLTSSDGLRLHSWFIKYSPDCRGGVVVTGMALLVAFQEKLVYVPVLPGLTKSYPITPARLRLIYDDVWLTSSDGLRLHSWFIKYSPDCRGPTILFLQENAGNIAHRLEMARIMLQNLHCNIFMLSYRGYGESDGYPTQPGLIMDAQAAVDHLSQRTDIDTSQIVVFGRSLGGAVGAAVTKNNPDKVAALILENTFTSILDMAGVLLPFLKYFIGGSLSKGPKILNFVVRSPWNTLDIVGQVKQPILFLSGQRDEMIPPLHMQMLYAKAAAHNKRCTFVEFPTGMHMDTWIAGGDHYWQTVQAFLRQNFIEKKADESEADRNDSVTL